MILIIVLGSITITTVLADTVTIQNYPYAIQDSSNNARLVITSSGNVGIRTSTPQASLQVYGIPQGPSPTILATAGFQSFYFNPYMCQGCVNGLVQSGDEALIFTNGLQNTGNFVLGSWSSSSTGIRITSSGNVGIGTASPVQKLDVAGGIHLTGNMTSPNNICIGSC